MKRGTKRKIKKFVSNNTYALFLVAVFAVLGFMTTGYALLKSTGSLNGLAEIIASSSEPSDPEDVTDSCSTNLETSMRATWINGDVSIGQFNVTINNDSSEAYMNWKLRIYAPGDYTASSAYVTSVREGDYLYISSFSWNAEIPAEDSYTFELEVRGPVDADMEHILDTMIMVTCGRATQDKEIITDGNASIELGQQELKLDVSFGEGTELGGWGGSANLYEVVLTNNTEYSTTDYRVVIYYGSESFNTAYPVNVISRDDANSLIELGNTASGDAPLAPGESLKFTLVLSANDTTYYPNIVAAGLKEITQ